MLKKYLLIAAFFAASNDAGAESPADKAKRIAAEKADQEKLDAEKAALAAEADKQEAAEKAETAKQAALDAALADDEHDGVDENDAPKEHPAQAAAKHLETIALSYPLTTPDEHVVFGFGGNRFLLGQLRALFNLKRGH